MNLVTSPLDRGQTSLVRKSASGLDYHCERHAMGELLGELSECSFEQARLLISVLVQ